MLALGFCFIAAYSGAHALPHITVQYEQSSASTGRYLESTGFDDARAGRLAERIGRTGEYLAQVGAVNFCKFRVRVRGAFSVFRWFGQQIPECVHGVIACRFSQRVRGRFAGRKSSRF